MSRLLVSVRSTVEAAAALSGGASLIDVKEPTRGSLGRADDRVIADVLRVVAGRAPVSAALGELAQEKLLASGGRKPPDCSIRGLTPPARLDRDLLRAPHLPLAYVKWGLSGCRDHDIWHRALLTQPTSGETYRTVAVAYADAQRANAPASEDVCAFAVAHGLGAFLLDTWNKDGSTLLDWLTVAQLQAMTHCCRTAHVPIALAGSLGLLEIRALASLRPDWFAVRGAVCHERLRAGAIDERKVRELVSLLDQ